MAKIEIKGEQHPISEVFSERFAFSVPPYQRPYAWTTEHAGELLDDLLGYLGSGDEPIDDLNPYFLGSIVLIKGHRPDAQIVDGQQRLITLTILLAVLRSLISDEFSESVTRRLYEPADPLNNIPARYRLQPKERDIPFFLEYIQREGGIERLRGALHQDNLSESQRNMRDNARFYYRELSDLPPAQRIRFAQFIVQRCLLVVVSTPDLSSAYRIFSVLNDRGLDLSSADILKAEIIGQIPEQDQQEYTARWENTEEYLGREGFRDLFGHILTIHQKARPQATILDGFRTHVAGPIGDPKRLIDENIVPFGSAYYVIRNASYQHAEAGEQIVEQINTMLRWLNRVENTDWIPPAMLYLSRYHNNPERLARFFSELERLATSFMIRRQYIHRRTPRYARLLIAIEQGEDLSRPASPIQLTHEERDATLGALSADFYLMAAIPRNYVLQRLDSSLADAGATYERKMLTVEHVLPRTLAPGSEWARWFPTSEEHSRWVHRLGNLALLSRSKNYQASNYDFARKKTAYFAGRNGVAPFALTTQILREEEWTPQVVQRRQEELLTHLKQLWRL